MGIDVHRAIRLDIGNGHGRANRGVLHVRQLIGGREFLVSGRERGDHVAFGFLTLLDRCGGPIGFFPEVLVESCIAGQAPPLGPLGAAGYLISCLDRFPLRECNHSDEIALHDDSRVREFGFVQLTGRDEHRSERLRMHHPRVQHARQAHIRRPGFLCSHFRTDDGILEGLADDRVIANGLHRRVALNGQPKDAGEVSLHRDREIQLLVLDEVTVRNALAASRHDAALDGKLVLRDAQPL